MESLLKVASLAAFSTHRSPSEFRTKKAWHPSQPCSDDHHPAKDREMASESTPLLPASEPHLISHHLTTPRAIAYQVTSIISAIDGVFGTWALSELKAEQLLVNGYGGILDIQQAFWAGFLLTIAGTFAGASCGILFLVLMLHPGHHETLGRVIAKESIFVFFSSFFLVASILMTIVVARGAAILYTPGFTPLERQELIEKLGGSLAYKDSIPAITFVVLGWVCWLSLVLSGILVSLAGRHVLRKGPALNAPKGLVERLADRFLPEWVFGTTKPGGDDYSEVL